MRSAFLLALALAAACSGPSSPPADAAGPCPASVKVDPVVSDGHADPAGARAAKQARAGRIKDAAIIRQPADARQLARVGDFMIANDKIAAIIEDKGLSDGYARFGGEILALDRVGDDGLMIGQSRYGETLFGFAGQMIDPESVGVLADGSDGKEAVIRVVGTLKTVPFLEAFAKALHALDFPMAIDFALAPGEEALHLRATLVNPTADERYLGGLDTTMHGFFHSSRNLVFSPEKGFAAPASASWAGFVSRGETSFAWRVPGANLKFGVNISGFQWSSGPDVDSQSCTVQTFPFADVIVGGPDLDGLREAVRRVDALPAWRAVGGAVKDGFGAPLPGAIVTAQAMDGTLLTQVQTDAQGAYALHAPPEDVMLSAWSRGYPPAAAMLGAGGASLDLAMGKHGTITVHATEMGTGAKLPVRVQVIPDAGVTFPSDALGIPNEINGRLHQAFVTTGDATLPVPPGSHRVVVSRGYEWELLDTKVTVTEGQDAPVVAQLAHSVDTTGVMCGDFHIHSFYSADASDPVVYKVQGAVADGLDVPCSSEHEWVIDFGPVVKQLGLEKWAFGMPSEELTTFAWGHMGVVPLYPKRDQVNNGAVEWIGKQPPEMFASVAKLPEQPVFIINHPRSGGIIGLEAYFTAASYDPATGRGAAPLWSDQFDAIECFNSSDFEENRNAVVKDWFSMLGAGKKLACLGNSDSHHLRSSPVGYPRTCMYFGHDDPTKLTPEAVRDALRTGRTTVSGGITMTAAGPGGEPPGQTVPPGAGPVPFTVTAAAPSWLDVDPNVEVIVDGKTVATQPLTADVQTVGKHWHATVNVDRPAGAHWVIFHVKGKGDLAPLHPGKNAFAMSNPIFF